MKFSGFFFAWLFLVRVLLSDIASTPVQCPRQRHGMKLVPVARGHVVRRFKPTFCELEPRSARSEIGPYLVRLLKAAASVLSALLRGQICPPGVIVLFHLSSPIFSGAARGRELKPSRASFRQI